LGICLSDLFIKELVIVSENEDLIIKPVDELISLFVYEGDKFCEDLLKLFVDTLFLGFNSRGNFLNLSVLIFQEITVLFGTGAALWSL